MNLSQRGEIMKKTAILMLSFVLATLLIGCAAPQEQAPPPVTKQPAPVVDSSGAAEDVSEQIDEVNSVDKDLDLGELDDIDSLLDDIGNI